MWIGLVTFISTIVFLKGSDSALLEPARYCVPTASVRGPCHVCVCSSEGIFHCRRRKCQADHLETKRPRKDCEPNYVYRLDSNTFCTCSSEGYWLSVNCEEMLTYLQPRNSHPTGNLRTRVSCIADSLYLIDCNVCRCSPNNVIDISSCTHRYCLKGHKADSCSYGDILRLEHEICSCSDINLYIDRLCISITSNVAQIIKPDKFLRLEDIGRSWRRLYDLQLNTCDTNTTYMVDCNQCLCVDGHIVCSNHICEPKKVMRSEKTDDIENLPELKSGINTVCEPGKKYRYKCNICTCTKDGSPSCTTSICLEDYVLDLKALKGILSSG